MTDMPPEGNGLFTCFGYGSLVNAATLEPGLPAVRARIRGWRRAWRHSGPSSYGRRCTLTVVADREATIDGVVIAQPAEKLPALDRREAQYERLALAGDAIEWLDPHPTGWSAPFLYVGKPAFARTGDAEHPIMLSYIDVVLSGFRAVHGEEGLARFVATTDDWHVPILDDRDRPRYPRALLVAAEERTILDDLLRERSCTIFR